jgi:hypothetical protein
VFDLAPEITLKDAATEHLKLKRALGRVTAQSLEADELAPDETRGVLR